MIISWSWFWCLIRNASSASIEIKIIMACWCDTRCRIHEYAYNDLDSSTHNDVKNILVSDYKEIRKYSQVSGSLCQYLRISRVSHNMGKSDNLSICQLYSDDARFVKFINWTGKTVILVSRCWRQGRCYWSAGVIIRNSDTFVWRFLGESALVHQDYFYLMPDPYHCARHSRFEWFVDYLDSDSSEEHFTLNSQEGPFLLSSLPSMSRGDSIDVVIRRKDKTVSTLENLCECELSSVTQEQPGVSLLPRLISLELKMMKRKFDQVNNCKLNPCSMCNEIHLFNLRLTKHENFFVL